MLAVQIELIKIPLTLNIELSQIRIPWFGGMLYTGLMWLPIVLLGFSLEMIVVGYQIVLVYQFWIHTQRIGKLGLVEEILNTPSHHRVHHASNEPYLDKNFGGIFILWDKVFGTFEEENSPVRFGIVHSIKTQNPFVVNFIGFKRLLSECLEARSGLLGSLKFIFLPRTKDFQQTISSEEILEVVGVELPVTFGTQEPEAQQRTKRTSV